MGTCMHVSIHILLYRMKVTATMIAALSQPFQSASSFKTGWKRIAQPLCAFSTHFNPHPALQLDERALQTFDVYVLYRFNPHPALQLDESCSCRVTWHRFGSFNPHPAARLDERVQRFIPLLPTIFNPHPTIRLDESHKMLVRWYRTSFNPHPALQLDERADLG